MGASHFDRRAFLKAAGLAGAGALAAGPALATLTTRSGLDRQGVDDETAAIDPGVADLASALEYDIERMFRFVSDEIRYEPYSGILRGAKGTLWGRAGNSADKAVLLAALLAAAAVPSRFVTGAIDETTAGSMLDAALYDAATETQHARGVLLGLAPDLPTTDAGSPAAPASAPSPSPMPSLDPASRALAEGFRAQSAALVETATTRLADGIATITEALAAAGVSIPVTPRRLPQRERDQHVWLQHASGPLWLDLDPSLPGAQRGATLTAVQEVLATLPDALRHRVSFEVVTESVSGGQLAQSTISEFSRFADELVGQPVTFLQTKPSGLSGLGVSIGNLLEGSIQYVPLIVAGQTLGVGQGAVTLGSGGGVLSGLGDPGGTEGQTTAEWLDVRVSSPDAEPVVARRAIFDRIGDVARGAGGVDLDALPAVELVDMGADDLDAYPPCRATHSFAVLGGALNGGWYAQDYASNDPPANVGVLGHLYHTVRETLAAQLGVAQGVRIFPDAPNVVSFSSMPGAPADGLLPTTIGLDIWLRSFGTQPVRGQPVTGVPAVLAGVLSHVAERTTLHEGQSLAVSVGRLFDEARAQDIATRLVRGPGIPPDLGVMPSAAPVLAAALAQGYVAVMPERPVSIDGTDRSGWWLVDPATGRTLDQMDDGRGDAAGEYVLPLNAEWRAYAEFLRLGDCVAKFGVLAAMVLGAASNFDPSMDLSTYLSYAAGAAGAAGEAVGIC